MALFGFIERVSSRSLFMEEMFARLDVRDWFATDPDGPKLLRRATLSCTACGHVRECAEWLGAHDRADRAPEFCRNRDLTDRVAQAMRRATGSPA